MRKIFIIILSISTSICFSQAEFFFVDPIQTDPNYAEDQEPHYVVRNGSTNLDRLFLFIGGTGSKPNTYHALSNFAGNLGFDVISISYKNSVGTYSLTDYSDSLIFNTYRQEICYGTPQSDEVDVDSLNSIYTRTVRLLNYLHHTYPDQNWNQYLLDSTVLDWSKIIVGGHSQGAGHACYFGKFHELERVLMFSGPNDYSNYFSMAAHWLRTPGITELNRHFAYLSLLDEVVPFSNQLANLKGLGLYPLYDSTYINYNDPPYGGARILYTTQVPGFAFYYHNTTIKSGIINNPVWTHMLTFDVSTGIEEVNNLNETQNLEFYPNPTSSIIYINNNDLVYKKYIVQNLTGQTIMQGKIPNTNPCMINLSTLKNGIYFISVNDQLLKVIKQ